VSGWVDGFSSLIVIDSVALADGGPALRDCWWLCFVNAGYLSMIRKLRDSSVPRLVKGCVVVDTGCRRRTCGLMYICRKHAWPASIALSWDAIVQKPCYQTTYLQVVKQATWWCWL
jgi:hypothetical protein